MHAMTSYFMTQGVVKSLAALMAAEIEDNKAAVPNYTQWSSDDVDTAKMILAEELVAEEQLPYSVMHIRALLDSKYEDGSFSEDGQKYEYVVCSSKNLRQMIDHPPRNIRSDDYLFFTI